jgi:ATP-dependent Clp protease ATP-binding subunit ClpB
MTSNIGSDEIQRLAGRPGTHVQEIREAALEHLRGEFRPEFLNRVDEIVVFRPLARDDLGRIVEIQLGRLRKLLTDRSLTLELTEGARETIADAGYDPVYGARPLKRAIQRLVQDPLAQKILRGEFKAGDHVMVDEGKGESLDFKKGERPAEPVTVLH